MNKNFLIWTQLGLVATVILLRGPSGCTAASCGHVYNVNRCTSEAILDLMENNFRTFLDHVAIVSFDFNDKIIHRTIYHILSLGERKTPYRHRNLFYASVHYLDPKENITVNAKKLNRNIIAIASSKNSSNWGNYLDLMRESKTNTALLVFTGVLYNNKIQLLHQMINSISSNSMFYLNYLTNDDGSDLMWFQVITLEGGSKSAINPILFDAMGRIIEKYDLQGMHIISVTLTWSPYFVIENCALVNTNCNGSGYLAEVMDVLAAMMNFTWESHREKDGNWGTKPISGPANSSGIWGGVIGNVFNGSYQLSIRYLRVNSFMTNHLRLPICLSMIVLNSLFKKLVVLFL